MIRQPVIDAACRVIEQATGKIPKVRSVTRVSGGSINHAARLVTDAGDFFLKYNDLTDGSMMLSAERQGLRHLSQGPLSVPEDVGLEDGVLVLEWIESSRPADNFWEQMGTGLATLHLSVIQTRWGLDHDNWIGATPQPNQVHSSWIDFFRDQRLMFQLQVAQEKRLLESNAIALGESLCERLDQLLVEPVAASLLHGDLWSGNYMVGSNGQPVLIDPAVYYGHSEAEFGIISLFGGFNQLFFEAYHDLIPRMDGYSERVEIYKLYHLLNHLNLFGSGYLNACLSILRRFH